MLMKSQTSGTKEFYKNGWAVWYGSTAFKTANWGMTFGCSFIGYCSELNEEKTKFKN